MLFNVEFQRVEQRGEEVTKVAVIILLLVHHCCVLVILSSEHGEVVLSHGDLHHITQLRLLLHDLRSSAVLVVSDSLAPAPVFSLR